MRSIPQVLLVAALLTIGACSRDVASPTPEALAVVDNALGPFESLGELHNAYLDFLAPRLKGSADKVQTIRSACVAFAIENRIRDVSGCYIDFAAVQARLKEARERRKGGIGSASWEQLNLVYYDALINLPYDCNACSVSSFNSQANAIYATAQADPEITTLELNELQGVVSVATSSWQYWKSQSNWQPYVDDEPLIPEFAIGVDVSQDWSWGDFWGCAFTDGIMWVGSSDIVGAIMGGGAGAGVSSGATAVMATTMCALVALE